MQSILILEYYGKEKQEITKLTKECKMSKKKTIEELEKENSDFEVTISKQNAIIDELQEQLEEYQGIEKRVLELQEEKKQLDSMVSDLKYSLNDKRADYERVLKSCRKLSEGFEAAKRFIKELLRGE